MALSFLNREVSELCLGKPALKTSVTGVTTVKDALTALKKSGETHLSVWSCSGNHYSTASEDFVINATSCSCIGKICMADVICFLCKEENLEDPFKALEAPVLDLLPKVPGIVKHLEPNSSLLEAIDCIREGTQNLVIPIEELSRSRSRRKLLDESSLLGHSLHNGHEYCWLTQEDVIRFLLNSVGVFSPLPTFTIESLNIIDHDIMTVRYDEPATLALECISRSIVEQTCVAVVDDDNRLIGEISPYTLACCDESAAAAIMTLSAGDLLAYIDYGGPPEDLVQLVTRSLEEKGSGTMLQLMEELSLPSMSSSSSSASSCSSDDESLSSRHSGSGRYSPGRRSEAIMCHPWSSVVAVMIQALAHRVSYVWVVQEDQTLAGIVTFEGILGVFRSIAGMQRKPEIGSTFKQ